MYKHILIATDGSDLAAKALAQGLSLAKALASQVTVVTVSEPWATQVTGEAAIAFPVRGLREGRGRQCRRDPVEGQRGGNQGGGHLLDRPRQGASSRRRHPRDGEGAACDLIVMASHGRRGLTRLLLGSQAHNVVTHSTIPVLICR